jgi:hypothetical protein
VALFALSAFAEPAVVSVFEAKVHESPNDSSAVIHTFPENAQISVSEEAQQGWRRVRLPNGATGWVQEKNLRIGAGTAAATPPASDAPLAAQPAPSEPKARIYVKDLPHLAELTKTDAVVHPKANQLAERHTQGQVAQWIGFGAGLGLVATSLVFFATMPEPGAPDFSQRLETSIVFLAGGVLVALAGGAVGAILSPKREDLLDVINEWNTRHPAEPFELDRVPSK